MAGNGGGAKARWERDGAAASARNARFAIVSHGCLQEGFKPLTPKFLRGPASVRDGGSKDVAAAGMHGVAMKISH